MREIHIGMDVDDVGFPFIQQYRKRLLRLGHRHPTPTPTTWHFSEQWGLSREEFVKLFIRFVAEGMFASGRPLPGFVIGLRRLKQIGCQVHIITARTIGPRDIVSRDTYRWFTRNQIPYDSVTFASSKQTIGGAMDCHLDDSVNHYLEVLRGGGRPYLLDTTTNRHFDAGEFRVHSINEFVDRIERSI